ncbi:hypothetical protein Fmac_020003 [Flemingia macrophylla]|uniref:Uncharacterized protein n=1 Tax=Flemingia macrophylla TaxID=520843 RepID=A0ABD1M9K5_9FABA
MRRSVIYKEQVRLNQAATNALMARLEAQRAICDAAEKDLHKKYKQRDDIEKQIRPEWEQGRKRSRIDYATFEERDSKEKLEEHIRSSVALDEEITIEHRLQKLKISEGKTNYGTSFPCLPGTEIEEDEETRQQRGKGNVEKWLQMLLENGQQQEGTGPQETNENASCEAEEIILQLDQKFPQKELNSKFSDSDYKEKQLQLLQDKNGWTEKEDRIENEARSVMLTGYKNYSEEAFIGEENHTPSFEGMERKELQEKGKNLARSGSARTLRRIPSSPSLLLGIRKGVDCIRKKSTASGDGGNEDLAASNSFLRSSIKTIKKAVKL